MQIAQLVWLGLVIVFVVAEGVTAALVSIWFCAGAVAALVVSLIWPDAIVAQAAVFLLVSAAALLALRPLAKRLTKGRRVPTNADASIGKLVRVVVEIRPAQPGRVMLEGQDWAATAPVTLPVGAWGRVVAIEGVKLVLEPAEAPA